MTDIEATLKERGSTYGDFTDNARIAEDRCIVAVKPPAPNPVYDGMPEAFIPEEDLPF